MCICELLGFCFRVCFEYLHCDVLLLACCAYATFTKHAGAFCILQQSIVIDLRGAATVQLPAHACVNITLQFQFLHMCSQKVGRSCCRIIMSAFVHVFVKVVEGTSHNDA